MEGIWDGKCPYQCDQLVRLHINIWPFTLMNVCPIPLK